MVLIRPDSHKYDITTGILVISLGILLLVPVNFAIVHLVPNHMDEARISALIAPDVMLREFMPEQAERAQYMISIVLFPILCFGLFRLSRTASISRAIEDRIGLLYPASVVAACLAIGVIARLDMFGTEVPFFYVAYSFFYNYPMGGLLAFLLMLMVLMFVSKSPSGTLGGGISSFVLGASSLLLIAVVSALPLARDYDAIVTEHHFNAYLYSVVQVFYGKTLLVDLPNQYGFYPYFLEPVFKLIGLSSLSFTLVMGLLLAVTFASIYLVLRSVVRNKMIAFCGLASIIFFQRVFATVLLPQDPYLQYHPHRLIFPAIFILSAYSFLVSKPQHVRLKYHLVFVIASLSVFWNPDTGLVVFLTWLIVLLYRDLLAASRAGYRGFIRKCFVHLVVAACYSASFTAAFLLLTYIRSGQLPNLGSAFFYANIFYGMGFNMLPMKVFHPWNLVVLCYAIGLVMAIAALRRGNDTETQESGDTPAGRTSLVLLLSVLGLGVFSYYQGRSHDYNLLAIWWPAFMLLTIFIDMIFSRITRPSNTRMHPVAYLKERGLELAVFLVLFFFLSSSVASIVSHYDFLRSAITDKWNAPQTELASVLQRNVDFIKANTTAGQEVYIFSYYYSALYHMNTHTANPVKVPGMSELFLRSDFDKIIDYFKNTKDAKVFVDIIGAREEDAPIVQEIAKYYTPTRVSPDKTAYLFERKPAPGN